ncbi:unnamed protein product [Ixodes pacificus]
MANGEYKQIRKKKNKERERERKRQFFLALLPPVHRKEGNKKKKRNRGACLAAEALDMHGMAGGPLHGWFRTAGPAGWAFLLAGLALFFLLNPFLDLVLEGNNPFK